MGIRTRIFFITLSCLFVGISLSFIVAERDLSLKLQAQIETELSRQAKILRKSISGLMDSDDLLLLKAQVDDYVTKPFSVRELILRVKAIMKRGVSIPENIKEAQDTFGELTVNYDEHQAYINDQEISLTALEFKLLKHLINRKGRVQTRDQLLEDVWGYSSNVTTRTVDTHIKRLREKLGLVGDHIQTIRGVGYRFSRDPN